MKLFLLLNIKSNKLYHKIDLKVIKIIKNKIYQKSSK